MTYEKISWKQLVRDCSLICEKMKKEPIDEIIAIARGGVVVGRIVSDILSLPIEYITTQSYTDFKQGESKQITANFSGEFSQKTVLLIDDLSDTGRTFQAVLPYLHRKKITKIFTAAVYIKPHTDYIPDFYARCINAWIIFPYELHETKTVFEKEYKGNVGEKLKELGFEEWEII